MLKLKEIIRLKDSALSQQQIARSLKISVGAVHKYLKLSHKAGMTWSLAKEMTEKELKAHLLPVRETCSTFAPPDYDWIHKEMKHKCVTLQLLHEEYCQAHPGQHYSYSQFCDLYRAWKKDRNLSLRQDHKGGEKLFTDYAGQTVPIVIDSKTKDVREAQIFVAVLGASNYTYAEATWSQSLPHWIGSHARAFEYFGGVPRLLVPDNLKSGVQKACKYDPDLTPDYAAMASHYGTAILPARPYRPKDKAKVEAGVLVVERWILACLRHRSFSSLEALNTEIQSLLEKLNTRPFKKMKGTRRDLFEAVDAPALLPLPQAPYEMARFYHRKVTPDYHLQHGDHFYSVPYLYVNREVDIRVSERTLEVLCDGERIALHPLALTPGKTTLPEHMPKKHLRHVEWTLEKALSWADQVGTQTKAFVEQVVRRKNHPDQVKRFCAGLTSLAKKYGEDRLEAACLRALHYQAYSYKRVAQILENHLDKEELDNEPAPPPLVHGNIRGSSYYH